jgi:hypothetical protein
VLQSSSAFLTLETQSYQRQLDRIRDLPPEDSLSSLSILENLTCVEASPGETE